MHTPKLPHVCQVLYSRTNKRDSYTINTSPTRIFTFTVFGGADSCLLRQLGLECSKQFQAHELLSWSRDFWRSILAHCVLSPDSIYSSTEELADTVYHYLHHYPSQ